MSHTPVPSDRLGPQTGREVLVRGKARESAAECAGASAEESARAWATAIAATVQLAWRPGEAWDRHFLRVARLLCSRLLPAGRRLVLRVWTGPLHFYSARFNRDDPGVCGMYSEVWCPRFKRVSSVTRFVHVGERERPGMQEWMDRALFNFQERYPDGTCANVGLTCGALSSAPGFCASARFFAGLTHDFGFFADTQAGLEACRAAQRSGEPGLPAQSSPAQRGGVPGSVAQRGGGVPGSAAQRGSSVPGSAAQRGGGVVPGLPAHVYTLC